MSERRVRDQEIVEWLTDEDMSRPLRAALEDLRDARAEIATLRAALRDIDGEAYTGRLEGHDMYASLIEIQDIARRALAGAEPPTKEATPPPSILDRDELAGAILYGRECAPDDWRWRWEETKRGALIGHGGDCTKEPMTCMLCLRDEALADADAVIAALRAAGAEPRKEGAE